jgi:hypothetical protein
VFGRSLSDLLLRYRRWKVYLAVVRAVEDNFQKEDRECSERDMQS